MNLMSLYLSLAKVFDPSSEIELAARESLIEHAASASYSGPTVNLPSTITEVLQDDSALSISNTILRTPLPWAPPETSQDPLYIEHSKPKVHVELIGPDGFTKSDDLRIGLYGMLPGAEYGIRKHPAEEVFVMLAGEVLWRRGEGEYAVYYPGERSYHPSMLKHGNKTALKAFMSVYVWRGDISQDGYQYAGAE